MAKSLVIGIAYPHELSSGIGHVACTLGGVNYESRGDRGILKGSVARGATTGLFRHRFYIVLSDAAATRTKQWADAQVGEPYVWNQVPGHGGDCSGFVSGLICEALGRPVQRVFSTGSWTKVYQRLGFKPGTGPSTEPTGLEGLDNVALSDRVSLPPSLTTQKSASVGDCLGWTLARSSLAEQSDKRQEENQAKILEAQAQGNALLTEIRDLLQAQKLPAT